MFRPALFLLLFMLCTPSARAQSHVSVESIQNWAQRQAMAQWADLKPLRIEVQVGALDTRLTQAPCAQPIYEVVQGMGMRLWGRSAVVVRCPATAWSMRAPMTVRIWGHALVAARTLTALTALGIDDVQTAEVELSREAQGVLTDWGQLAGRVSTRTLSAGQPIPLAALRAPQVMGQGDPVKVVGQGQGFAIATEATALSAALDGQNVRVRTESGRILTGTARSGRVVEVAF